MFVVVLGHPSYHILLHIISILGFVRCFSAKEGDASAIKTLLYEGADVNALDSKGRTPLDDAWDQHYMDCVKLLEKHGASKGARTTMVLDADHLDCSHRRTTSNMEIDFYQLEVINRIGEGAFGEIYKCR